MTGNADNRIVNHNGQQAVFVDTTMIERKIVLRYSANQTNVDVLTPPSGFKVCVRGISSRSSGNTGTIALDFLTSGKAVYDHYVSVQSNDGSSTGHIVGAVDEPLTINTTTGNNAISISIAYTFHE